MDSWVEFYCSRPVGIVAGAVVKMGGIAAAVVVVVAHACGFELGNSLTVVGVAYYYLS